MTIEVTKATGGKKKTTAKIDIIQDVPAEVEDEVKDAVGSFIVEQILLNVADAKSPIVGERFPKLSKEYAKDKKAMVGGRAIANLELTGDMLASLTFDKTATGVEVGIWGSEADKADGHNQLSGRDSLTKQRRFIPDKGQTFKFQKEIDGIIDDIIAEAVEFEADDFSDVETKKDLMGVLESKFPGLGPAALVKAAKKNPDILDILDDMDLLGLLK